MDFTEAYSDRCSAAGLAAREGDAEVLQKLIAQGHSLDVPDNRGWMPIHEAAAHSSSRCLRLLLNAGADINCQAKDRATPLLIAAQEGHATCVELLLSKGADPNLYCNEDNWQLPIHAAAEMGHKNFFSLVDILLNYKITLLGINLGYCLYHEKFALFRRFLKMGCPLPSHEELPEFLSHAVKALDGYMEWLPYLLLSGFNPVNLLYRFWLHSVSEDVLNFILEFTNWKRLPPAVEQNLADYKEKFNWTPKSHFATIPSLSHLCRLEIRSILGSERLRCDEFIRALPLPVCLQDDLLFLHLLPVSTALGAEENLRQREEGAPSATASSSDRTEKGDACNSPAR
ncbi:hypothetical protein ASZ78_003561 [Callipepla squamata]|uniref:SOCS box domain-containing protein n=1 Tax=Callipepla squamata TaxID=9009 RepID=A0A226MDA5_CALSU|nr:hypothetical protein ASZ78_003561 [Callipepla squamata]